MGWDAALRTGALPSAAAVFFEFTVCFLQPIPDFSQRGWEGPVGSRGRGAEGTGQCGAAPRLSLPALGGDALPFSALWDGTGNAGAALLQTECSINSLSVQLCRAGCKPPRAPRSSFLSQGLASGPSSPVPLGFARVTSQRQTKASWAPVLLWPTWVQYLGSAQVLDLFSDANLVCKAGAAG